MDEMIRVQAQLLLVLSSLERIKKEATAPQLTWLDAQEVMEMFHLSSRTLLRLRSKRILPCYKLAGKIYYRKEEIENLLLKNQHPYSSSSK